MTLNSPTTHNSLTALTGPEWACVGLGESWVAPDLAYITQGALGATSACLANMSGGLIEETSEWVSGFAAPMHEGLGFRFDLVGCSDLQSDLAYRIYLDYLGSNISLLFIRVNMGFLVDQSLNTNTQTTNTNPNNTYPNYNNHANHHNTNSSHTTSSTDANTDAQTRTSTYSKLTRKLQAGLEVCISTGNTYSLICASRVGFAHPLAYIVDEVSPSELVLEVSPAKTSCSDVWEKHSHLSPGINNNLRVNDVDLKIMQGHDSMFGLSKAGQLLSLGIGVLSSSTRHIEISYGRWSQVKDSIRKMLRLNLKLSHDGLHSVMGDSRSHYRYSA